MRRLAVAALCLALAAPQAQAQAQAQAQDTGWLEWFNTSMHGVNLSARQGLARLAAELPEAPALPPAVRQGAGNLITTWVANPWQALSLTVAGRPSDALVALDRSRANIIAGRGGLDDRAGETGMAQPPAADIGLALCALGVPEGPYVVLPLVGGRTLRDGLSDLVVANAVIYSALLPLIGTAPSLELILVLQVLDNVPIWLLADRMGRTDAGTQADDLGAIRAGYLAARRQACETLRAPG